MREQTFLGRGPRSSLIDTAAERCDQFRRSVVVAKGDSEAGQRRVVLEQTAAGCGPDFGALVPNATTVEAIEAARRGEVVEIGTPAEALAELNRDD